MRGELLDHYRRIAKDAGISVEKLMMLSVALAMDLIVEPAGRYACIISKRVDARTRMRMVEQMMRCQQIGEGCATKKPKRARKKKKA